MSQKYIYLSNDESVNPVIILKNIYMVGVH